MPSPNASVIDVMDGTFASDVLEESRRRPVVVDFWAAWCQPCRVLGPVLERLAADAAGSFLLAKLDVDANPQAATAFRIQGIPAVKAFRDGAVVDEFVGALPEDSVRRFIDSLLPSDADRLVEQAEESESAGRTDEAERLFRAALDADPGHTAAAVGMGRLALARDDLKEARRLLEPVRPDAEAERLLAAIDVAEWGSSPDADGGLRDAHAAAAEGRFVEALNGFLAEVMAAGPQRDAAKEAMVKLFSVLGDQDPLTQEYRRRLTAALF